MISFSLGTCEGLVKCPGDLADATLIKKDFKHKVSSISPRVSQMSGPAVRNPYV